MDEQGRSLLFSIAQDRRRPQEQYDAGWAHNAGLPLVLGLNDDDTLRIEPVPELANLRDEQLVSFTDSSLMEANDLLAGVEGDMLEILVEVEAGTADRFGLKVRHR